MKRRISLLLAVVMILGTFSFAFAADVNEKVDLVTKEGILRGDQGTNALRLDDPLARKEAVVLLSRLMDVEEAADNFEKEGLPTFADVQDAVYYKSFIAWAEDNKYFNGNPDGTFGFNDNLTVKEYAAVLLRALGYAEEVYNVEGWKNVEKLANDLNLLEDVETELNDDATRREVAVMTFNALGAKMKDSDKTLAEFLGIEMPVEKPEKAEAKVYSENLKEVVVELNDASLVDAEKLTDVNNYRMVGYKFEKATLDGDKVVLLIADEFDADDNLIEAKSHLVKGRKYELILRNLVKDINKTYEFKAEDNAIPAVENVEVLGEYGIKVTTTEPVVKPLERNFLIDGKNVAMIVEQYGRDIILSPYYKTSFDLKAEKLTVKGLVDFDGYRSVEKDFDIEVVKDEEAPVVKDVVAKGNVVEVTFDKDIYHDSVAAYYSTKSTGNMSYEAGRHNIYADKAKKVDTNVVRYTFKDELPRRTVLTIVGVQNHSKETMEKTTMEARVVLDYTEPEVIDTYVWTNNKDKAEIYLTFDKDVKGSFEEGSDTEFIPKDHFTLYEREVLKKNISKTGKVVSAKYDGSRRDVIVVELEGLNVNTKDGDYDYILEVVDFTDASALRNKMYRYYVDFDVKTKGSAFEVTNITHDVLRNGDAEVYIELNKAVDRERAETEFANYLFKIGTRKYDVKDLDGKIIVDRNGKRITLVIPEFNEEHTTELEILQTLKDKDGARLAAPVTYDFNNGLAEEIIVKNGSAKLENGKYVVTPDAGKTELEIETGFDITIVLKGTLTKAIVNAPNAHLVVDGDIGELVIEAIGSESVEILKDSTVVKLTVATVNPVRVYGNVDDMVLTTTKEKAVVNVSLKATDKAVEIGLKEGEEKVITVDEDGKIDDKLTEEQEEENKKEKDKAAVEAAKKLFEGKSFKDVEAIDAVEVEDEEIEIITDVTAEPTLVKEGKAIVTLTKGEAKAEVVVTLETLDVVELEVKGMNASEVKYLAFGLVAEGTEGPQIASTLAKIAEFIHDEYDGAELNIDNIDVVDGKITITGPLLSEEDWVKIKGEEGTGAYNITLLTDGINMFNDTNKIKISMYKDGNVELTDLR